MSDQDNQKNNNLIPFEIFSKKCTSKRFYEHRKIYYCGERYDEYNIVICSEENCSNYHFYKIIYYKEKQ